MLSRKHCANHTHLCMGNGRSSYGVLALGLVGLSFLWLVTYIVQCKNTAKSFIFVLFILLLFFRNIRLNNWTTNLNGSKCRCHVVQVWIILEIHKYVCSKNIVLMKRKNMIFLPSKINCFTVFLTCLYYKTFCLFYRAG